MDLLADLKMLLLNFSFVMIYINHEMLVMLKNYLNYFKDDIFECSLRSIIHFFFLNNFFHNI